MTGFQVRTYRPADAAAVAAIYVASVTGLGPRGYEPRQVAAWVSRARTEEELVAWASDGRLVLVAIDDADIPIAFIDLEEDGHIDMMFCRPDWAGRKVVSALYGTIEAEARNRGMVHLYTEASEVAKPVFSHWGFCLLHRNDMEIEGVAIHNYTMEKHLGSAGVAD